MRIMFVLTHHCYQLSCYKWQLTVIYHVVVFIRKKILPYYFLVSELYEMKSDQYISVNYNKNTVV